MALRRLLTSGLLRFAATGVYDKLLCINELEFASTERLEQLRDKKLTDLIDYCYRFVPYYKDVLEKAGVITEGRVLLENFKNIPPLTKQIIRSEGDNLLPRRYDGKGRYENTSGGSTGEPVRFYQDSRYEQLNTANKLYFNRVLGKRPGDAEIKLWGSDRDIIQGSLTAKDRLINFFYNRRFFNCYNLGDEQLEQLRLLNNSFKPCAYWSYMEAANELADYIAKTDKYFYPPKLIVSTIGLLPEHIRQKIEKNLRCDVYNQYGSREVGAIACECGEKDGLHTFPWSHYVEMLDERLEPVEKGGEGEVFITPLENYAMPMLRYAIGDVAVSGGSGCGCGRGGFKLQEVKGRTLGYFVRGDGSLAHSHFIVQALFFHYWIERFQVVQDSIDRICINIKKRSDCQAAQNDIEQIKQKCRAFMGQGCEVELKFVDSIEPTASGKYLYTICKVKRI